MGEWPSLAAMDWLDADHLVPALVCAVVCGALGWFLPRLIARIPEPVPEAAAEPVPEAVPEIVTEAGDVQKKQKKALPPPPPKELYADIAAAKALAARLALASALVGALFGGAIGWGGALVYLVPLVPIGVALALIDWRTTLLPTWLIAPTYIALIVLIPVAALIDGDVGSLYRAGWGWLIIGGYFFGFWFIIPAVWGYGDVRLSGVLGLSLGYLGWSQLLVGAFAIVFVGGLGGVVLTILKLSSRKRFPYGPFMLIGAVIGGVFGPEIATSLGY